MAKSVKKVQVRHYGMDGVGANVTEAKQDAARKIEAALTGHYVPEVLTHRGYAILIFREPAGWCQRIIATPEGVKEGRVWASANYDNHEDAKRAALAHLADLGWTQADGEQPPAFLTEQRDIDEFKSKVRFQVRYQQGRNAGLNDTQAHAFACGMLTLSA